MLHLLTLPNELLLNIIKTIPPHEIENFSQSCKLIHCLSKEALREYKYSSLTLSARGPTQEYPKAIRPLSMLRHVLQNDRVPLYPVELLIPDIYDLPKYCKSLRSKLSEVPTPLAKYHGQVFSLLSNCPYLDRFEVREWHRAITDGIDDAAVAFLLTILPNVERITIHHHCSSNDDFLREMMDKISRVTYNPWPEVRQRTALSKVYHVTITGGEGLTFHNMDLTRLGLFAALPSIQSINGRRLNAPDFQSQRRPGGLVPYSPSLQELHFTGSAISYSILSQLLRNVKNLQRFTYTFEFHWQSTISDARKIVPLLQKYAKSSLVQLEISKCRATDGGCFFFPRFAKALRTFQVLERIRVDVELLVLCPFNSREPQPLTGMLPPSIEELELVGEIDKSDASLMFAGLVTSKENLFPNFRRILFEDCWMPLSESMQAECEAAGISLEVTTSWDLIESLSP